MQTFDRLVTVFGGSGFVGRHVVRALAKRGFRIRVAVRRPDLAGHLQPLGSVGQINFVQANLRYPDSVRQAVEGAEFVVNCVGILFETGRQRFDAVQARGAGTVAKAAEAVGALAAGAAVTGVLAGADAAVPDDSGVAAGAPASLAGAAAPESPPRKSVTYQPDPLS